MKIEKQIQKNKDKIIVIGGTTLIAILTIWWLAQPIPINYISFIDYDGCRWHLSTQDVFTIDTTLDGGQQHTQWYDQQQTSVAGTFQIEPPEKFDETWSNLAENADPDKWLVQSAIDQTCERTYNGKKHCYTNYIGNLPPTNLEPYLFKTHEIQGTHTIYYATGDLEPQKYLGLGYSAILYVNGKPIQLIQGAGDQTPQTGNITPTNYNWITTQLRLWLQGTHIKITETEKIIPHQTASIIPTDETGKI